MSLLERLNESEKWVEKKHPRQDDGKFGKKPVPSTSDPASAPVTLSPELQAFQKELLKSWGVSDAPAAVPAPAPAPVASPPAPASAAVAAPPTPTVPGKRIPSKYQQAIFDWISKMTTQPKGALIVDAKAGSGKTSTIEDSLKLIPKTQKVVFLAFNKHIAEELERRTKGSDQVLPSTLSAFGWAACRKAYPWEKKDIIEHCHARGLPLPDLSRHSSGPALDDKKVPNLVDQVLTDKKDRDKWKAEIVDLIKFKKQYYSEDVNGKPNGPPIEEIAAKHEIELPQGADLAKFMAAATEVWKRSIGDTKIMDFADQVFFPAWKHLALADKRKGLTASYSPDWAMVDETQDLSMTEATFVKRIAPRTVCVGDPHQCAPAGSMVSLPGWEQRPIETLKNGDKVIAFSRESKAVVGREDGFPIKVASRHFDGNLVRVRVGDNETRTTPNHRWLVRWRDRKADHKTCVVYLMQKGERFRVGWCQMFAGSDHTFHLTHRARIEKADRVWILRAFKNRTDASVYESVVAAKYGLPTITFQPVNGAKHLTAESIESVFEALQGEQHTSRAKDCLEAHGRQMDLPLWPPIGKSFAKMGRTTLFETYAANLEPDLMAIPVPVDTGREVIYKPIESVTREPFSGLVYSLKVAKHETYIQDGLITHNSIYLFKGSDPSSMTKLKATLGADQLPLSISYRCPKAVIAEAQKIVPNIEAAPTAKEGKVDRIPWNAVAEHAKPGSYVLCRTTAPLVQECLRMISMGKKASVKGKDIGVAVGKLIDKVNKKGDASTSIHDFHKTLQEFLDSETKRLIASKKDHLIPGLEDKVETIHALSSGAKTVGEIKKRVDDIFSKDDSPGVTFSTVHKAKGLEADRIFIMRPDLMPFPKATSEDQLKQEMNLKYVAITRAKDHLTWVDPPPKQAKEESTTFARLVGLPSEQSDFPSKYVSVPTGSNRTGIGTAPAEMPQVPIRTVPTKPLPSKAVTKGG